MSKVEYCYIMGRLERLAQKYDDKRIRFGSNHNSHYFDGKVDAIEEIRDMIEVHCKEGV